MIKGETMSDITIALDAGHGGSDPGATYNGRPQGQGLYLQDLRLHLRVGHPAGGLPVPHLRPSGL